MSTKNLCGLRPQGFFHSTTSSTTVTPSCSSSASRNSSKPLRPLPRTRNLLVGMIQERFQLAPGEGPSFRLALGFVGVRCSIPVVDHLDRVSAEVPQALVAPAVGWVGQEFAELPYGTLIVAQGGADAAVHSPQIGCMLATSRRCAGTWRAGTMPR